MTLIDWPMCSLCTANRRAGMVGILLVTLKSGSEDRIFEEIERSPNSS